ncbi:MAG: hypothetical protein MIO92_07120, partial [Methanosarcinaceae archaeon]|nr:hypothetical protein [Methanosarcinaceae archaeon]
AYIIISYVSKSVMFTTVVMLTAFNGIPSGAMPIQEKYSSITPSASLLGATNLPDFESADFSNPDCPTSSYSADTFFSLSVDEPSPLIIDALPNPIYISLQGTASLTAQAVGTGSMAPGRYDTSVFMTGDVTVDIVFPESSGSSEN